MNAETPIDELRKLADLVRRLTPNWRAGEEFYEVRSEVVGGLNRLARRLTREPPIVVRVRAPATPPPPRPPPPSPSPRALRARALRAQRRVKTIACTVCGRPFRTIRSGSMYCSDACSQKAYRRRLACRTA